MSLPDAFTRKTMQSTCTVWVGATNGSGYGIATVNGRQELAHRVAYAAERGPIPEGMVLDHLCRVRNCVKVDHLDLVTIAENNRRGRAAASLQEGDTCTNGHTIGPGGLYVRPSGKTECRTCRASESHRSGRRRPTRQQRAERVKAQVA